AVGHAGRGGGVGHHDDLVVWVGGGGDDAGHTVLHQAHPFAPDVAGGAAGGDDDADRRVLLQPRGQVVHAGVLLVVVDPGGEADAVAVGLQRPGARLVRVGLGRLAAPRGGRGKRAPVVEDPRHWHDLAGPLGDPQHQVPVLGALVLGPEAAHQVHQRGPQHAEVAGVHLGAEAPGAPVRLVERTGAAALGGDLFLIGVSVVR